VLVGEASVDTNSTPILPTVFSTMQPSSTTTNESTGEIPTSYYTAVEISKFFMKLDCASHEIDEIDNALLHEAATNFLTFRYKEHFNSKYELEFISLDMYNTVGVYHTNKLQKNGSTKVKMFSGKAYFLTSSPLMSEVDEVTINSFLSTRGEIFKELLNISKDPFLQMVWNIDVWHINSHQSQKGEEGDAIKQEDLFLISGIVALSTFFLGLLYMSCKVTFELRKAQQASETVKVTLQEQNPNSDIPCVIEGKALEKVSEIGMSDMYSATNKPF